MKSVFILAGFWVTIFFISCEARTETKEELSRYEVTAPLKIDTSFNKEYVAQIKSIKDVEIRAQEKGFLQNIYVDEGQHVHAGQVLFRIMPKAYEAELLKAQAEADGASIELQNTKTLADKNIISKNEQSLAETKLSEAKAEMALARLHLSFTEIKAPFDGTIDRIPKKPGSLIDEGELLTTLSDNSQMFAYFNLSEPEYLDYQTNIKERGKSEVTLLLANNEPLKYSGVVETVESEFDSETGNIAFRAKFPNPERLLKNGETGKVVINMPLKNALIIPQKSTYDIQDKKFVFVVDNDNVVHSKEITVASEMPDLYVIKEGLSEKDKVLLEGVQKVKDGDRIRCAYEKPDNIINNLRLKAD